MVEIINVYRNMETGAIIEQGHPVNNTLLIVYVAIMMLIPVALYVFRAIGLYVMAKRAGLKCKVMAIFPCVWIYVACKLCGKQRVFGRTFEQIALLFCILFTIAEVLAFAYEFLAYFPIIGNMMQGNGTIYISNAVLDSEKYVPTIVSSLYGEAGRYVDPYGGAVYLILTILYYLTAVTDIVSIVISVIIYFNLFRKYWPQHFILGLILSIFGLFGIFVFVVRKREPVDYAKYARERYQNTYGYNPYNQNPYRNPYQNNPYQNNPYQNQPKNNGNDSPFEEFKDKKNEPEDPFDEFK